MDNFDPTIRHDWRKRRWYEAIGILSFHYSRQGLHRFTRISNQRLKDQIEAVKMVPRDIWL